MIKLYGIPNCNTVKKARTWLEQHGVAYQFHDFRKDGISAELLQGWLQSTSWEKLVNRAGMTWRGLSEETKSAVQDPNSAIRLMLEKPSVIKRPVLERDGKLLLLGFAEADYQHITS
jgi:Spx/MgsR family transcriptional regulator